MPGFSLLLLTLFELFELFSVKVFFIKLINSADTSAVIVPFLLLSELAALDAVVCLLFVLFLDSDQIHLEYKLTAITVVITQKEVPIQHFGKTFANIEADSVRVGVGFTVLRRTALKVWFE